jgi:hypothetical protein
LTWPSRQVDSPSPGRCRPENAGGAPAGKIPLSAARFLHARPEELPVKPEVPPSILVASLYLFTAAVAAVAASRRPKERWLGLAGRFLLGLALGCFLLAALLHAAESPNPSQVRTASRLLLRDFPVARLWGYR